MFIANALPPTSIEEPIVENDGWFPDMDPTAVRNACLLDGCITATRLRPALVDAMLSINRELQGWADAQRAQGHARLADVPGPRIAGDSALLMYYRRAVHACLQADLAGAFCLQAAMPECTCNGKHDAGLLAQAQQDYHRRNQRWALADLMGAPRPTVEMI